MKLRDQARRTIDGRQAGFSGPLHFLLTLVDCPPLFDFLANYQDDDELWTEVEQGFMCSRAVVRDKLNRVIHTYVELDNDTQIFERPPR